MLDWRGRVPWSAGVGSAHVHGRWSRPSTWVAEPGQPWASMEPLDLDGLRDDRPLLRGEDVVNLGDHCAKLIAVLGLAVDDRGAERGRIEGLGLEVFESMTRKP